MKEVLATICMAILLFIYNCSLSEGVSMKEESNKLDSVYFIPQSDFIVGTVNSHPNPSIRFWSSSNGELKEIIELEKKQWAVALAVSNDGKFLAVSLLGNQIGCYSLTEKKWLWKENWLGKSTVRNSMKFTLDDRRIVVVGKNNIVIFDAMTGAILKNQEDSRSFSAGFPEQVTRNHALSPSTKYAAFWQGNLEHNEGPLYSKNIWVVVRDIENEKTISKQGNIQKKYKNCSAVFSPDEKSLLLGSMDGRVRLWSIIDQKVIKEWPIHEFADLGFFKQNPDPYGIDAILFSPDGYQLATMANFGIKIWDYKANRLIHEFPHVISSSQPMCAGYPMSFSRDSKYFLFEKQGQLCLYDTKTWKEKWCVFSIQEVIK